VFQDRPIVFDLRSIVRKYWKNHICVINEALKCCHFYVNYKGVLEYYDPKRESILCPTPNQRLSTGPRHSTNVGSLSKSWTKSILDPRNPISLNAEFRATYRAYKTSHNLNSSQPRKEQKRWQSMTKQPHNNKNRNP
jgi:hypothetical protein